MKTVYDVVSCNQNGDPITTVATKETEAEAEALIQTINANGLLILQARVVA